MQSILRKEKNTFTKHNKANARTNTHINLVTFYKYLYEFVIIMMLHIYIYIYIACNRFGSCKLKTKTIHLQLKRLYINIILTDYNKHAIKGQFRYHYMKINPLKTR